MNGELNLHGGSSNTFVIKALYGDGSLNADMTYRNPSAIANGGALGIRGYYLGVHSKILSLGANTGAEYWSFTGTALSASDHSIIKAFHISASGDIHITGTGSLSGSIVSTGSFGLIQTDNSTTSSIGNMEFKPLSVGGGIAVPGGVTRVNVQSSGVVLGDQIHYQAATAHRAVHLKAGAEDYDVFIHRDSNSVGDHTGLAFGVWSGNYAGKAGLFFERQGSYGVGRLKIAVDSAKDSGTVAPANSVIQFTSASVELESGIFLSGSLTSTASFGAVGILTGTPDANLHVLGDGATGAVTATTGTTKGNIHVGGTGDNNKAMITMGNQTSATTSNPITAIGSHYSGGAGSSLFFGISTTFASGVNRIPLIIGPQATDGQVKIESSGVNIVGNLTSTGDIRANGDVIANQLIVSSSITHMTTSFSSGSTKFGDTNDDTHTFTGSLIQSGGMNVFASASFFGHDNTSAGWASVNSETGMINVSMSKDGADTSHGIVIRHHYNETGTAYPLLIQNVGGTNKAYIDYTGAFNGDKISFDMAGFKGSIDGDSGNNSNMLFNANSRGFTFKSEGKTLLDMTGTGGGSTLDIQSNTIIKDDLLVTGSISLASGSITGSHTSTGSFHKAYSTQYHLGPTGKITSASPSIRYATPAGTIGFFNGSTQFFKFYYNSDGRGILFAGGNPGFSSYPTYTFDTDWNTGMSNPVQDSLGFYAAGTEVIRVNVNTTDIKSGDIVFSSTGSISGSIVSTGSFGHLVGDGSGLTNVPSSAIDGTLGIFLTTGSFKGTTNDLQITGSVDVTGSFSATAKSFVIPHPAKDEGFLQHGSLEGPEHGVYVRGHLHDNNEIILPDYWDPLVDESTISVQLTPIGTWQQLFVKEVSNNKVVVQNRLDGLSLIHI